MPRFWLLGVTCLLACASPEFSQQRLQDGSLKVTCELPMDECVSRAQELCSNQRFRIIDGTSETRVSDAPPFERAYRTSRLHLKCTNDGAEPLLSLDRPPSSPTAPPPPIPPTPRVCTVGETRVCVGAAACQGGQVCLADGSGFGACDCGTSPPAGAAPSVSTPSDAAPSPPLPPAPVPPPTAPR